MHIEVQIIQFFCDQSIDRKPIVRSDCLQFLHIRLSFTGFIHSYGTFCDIDLSGQIILSLIVSFPQYPDVYPDIIITHCHSLLTSLIILVHAPYLLRKQHG